MSDHKNKQYTVELSEGEAERIEERAQRQGVQVSDFLTYCVRSICFGINYAIDKLADTGQVGTDEDSKGIK